MGCFFRPMRSRMLLVMRSKMGCAASEGGKSLFLQRFVGFGRAAVTATGLSNYATSSRGNMLNMRHLPRKKIRTMTPRPTPSVQVEYEVCSCPSRADMPRTAGRMGFSGSRSRNFYGKAQNQGPGKIGKIYLCWRAPPHFVRFRGAPGFSPKTGFSKSTNFRWNHWKRSAKRSRCENPFLHGGVWNRPS